MTTAAAGPTPHVPALEAVFEATIRLSSHYGIAVRKAPLDGRALHWNGRDRVVTLASGLDYEWQARALQYALRRAAGGRHAVPEFVPRRHLRAV